MAKVAVGQWVPHVEAFVDVSRPPAQHSASVDALAALVNKDKLSLFDLVSKMEMYLTTTDHIVRSRGILLLGEILCRISFKQLDVNAISTLSDFFISRLSDWQALRGALVGCLALLQRKQTVGSIIIADVKRLLEIFLQNVQVQSLAATDRKLCFQILNYILDHYPEAVKTMGDELLYGICEAIDEEKDPECLKLSFHLVEAVMKLFPDPSGLAAQYANEVFEILSKYYPIYFTHGVGDDLDATRDDLSKALMHTICSTPYFEPFAIPLLLDKLSSSLPLAKLDSLKYLDNCIRCYGANRMGRHATNIWLKLKEVIFSLSIDQILSTSGSSKDMEKNKNQIVSEALTCLKTAVTHMGPSDEDRLINLILLDEDIVSSIHSVASEETSGLTSLQNPIQLHALGSVISILAESSAYFCTRVLQAHFARLVDSLEISAGRETQHLNNCSGPSSGAINYGSLYLSVQMLSSCREVALACKEDFSPIKSAKESWWLILDEKMDSLIHLLQSLLTIESQSVQSAVRQEYVSCAVKGLIILATFPEPCSPLSANAYEDVLLTLTSVIMSKYENVHLWRLSLKALASIGSSILEFHASQKENIYNKVVVDKISFLDEPCRTSIPLNLRLEACFEVGTSGSNCMLFTFGGVNELALNFAMRLWNEIRDLAISDRIGSQGLLSSLMMGMKLVVGICTEEQQSLIVQKAYDTISSMLSLPVKSMTQHLLTVDEPIPLYSVRDTSLMCMFSSVIVGLRPQTPVPDMLMMINLFTVFLLKGQIPAAHALASIFNKNLYNSEFSHENKLDKVIDTILERCFSTISLQSNMKISLSYAVRSDDANFSESLSGSIESKNDIISGLAWLGKGLLMRGDEKVKDVSLFLLKCLCSDQSLAGISSHQEEHGINNSSYASLATSAADAFHVMMSDSEVCLNKKFHARIKPLYKQRFFSILMPIFLSKIKESTVMTTKLVLYRAFGHIISNAPVPAVITEARQILLVMVDSLAKLSQDVKYKDLVYSLLLVLSGMLMDEKGKECIVENIHIIVSVLTQLVSYPHMMLPCLVFLTQKFIACDHRSYRLQSRLLMIRKGQFAKRLFVVDKHVPLDHKLSSFEDFNAT
uniref:MMS19 nucleotide excision repair protein n=1 Tax=Oryza punctata TaxID=4537 RepID=A0A0E0LHR8_ORYPU